MRIIRNLLAVLALSALPLAAPVKFVHAATATVKPQPLPIQTVTFNTWELPAFVDVVPNLGGVTFDVYMVNGACTQSSVNPSTPRVAFQSESYEQEIDAYGTYCFYVNAWTVNGDYLTATILTTVKVVKVAAPKPGTQANTTTSAAQFNSETVVHN